MSDTFRVADPVRVAGSDSAWTCDIVRLEDGHVVKKIAINPETLPPRYKGRKIIWQLPTDGSCPSFGVHEQERVIAIFKEMRKRGKKEKKPSIASAQSTVSSVASVSKGECSSSKSLPESVIRRAMTRWIWKVRFRSWIRESRRPTRYSVDELLLFRRSCSSSFQPLDPTLPIINSPAIQYQAPPGLTPLTSPPPGLFARQSSSPHFSSAPGSRFSSPRDAERCGAISNSSYGLMVPFSAELEDEAAWKHAWKMQYLARLDVLAETAWQNHISRHRMK